MKPEVWIIVIPDFGRQCCRPEAVVLKSGWIEATGRMSMSGARKAVGSPYLSEQWNKDAEVYQNEPGFHNRLKGRLLAAGVVTQIIQGGPIAHHEFLKPNGRPLQNLNSLQSQIAWNIRSAMYYKLGVRPWKRDGVREGVCYLGLVFKQDTEEVLIYGKVRYSAEEWRGFPDATPSETNLVGIRIDIDTKSGGRKDDRQAVASEAAVDGEVTAVGGDDPRVAMDF